MRYCKNCGYEINDEVKFCPNCGIEIVETLNEHQRRMSDWYNSCVKNANTIISNSINFKINENQNDLKLLATYWKVLVENRIVFVYKPDPVINPSFIAWYIIQLIIGSNTYIHIKDDERYISSDYSFKPKEECLEKSKEFIDILRVNNLMSEDCINILENMFSFGEFTYDIDNPYLTDRKDEFIECCNKMITYGQKIITEACSFMQRTEKWEGFDGILISPCAEQESIHGYLNNIIVAYNGNNMVNLGVNMRLFAEHYANKCLSEYAESLSNYKLNEKIDILVYNGIINEEQYHLLNSLRIVGNAAAHGNKSSDEEYKELYWQLRSKIRELGHACVIFIYRREKWESFDGHIQVPNKKSNIIFDLIQIYKNNKELVKKFNKRAWIILAIAFIIVLIFRNQSAGNIAGLLIQGGIFYGGYKIIRFVINERKKL